jgi:hypothetical protein
MSSDAYITTVILAITFALLIKSKIPPVAIFVGALTLTITFRLAPLSQSLKGFSNPGMLTIGALLMVAAGMYSTGAITLITEKLIGRPKNMIAAQAKILPPVAVGSAFLNNTPLVAMFIPVIRDLSKTCRLAATRLYIPLSFSSILGGTCTLIGTATPYLGQTGIEAQFIDGGSKKVIAEFSDLQIGRKYGAARVKSAPDLAQKWATGYLDSFTTWGYAKEAFKMWASFFRERFDELRGINNKK